jgi:hypothetical protein
MTVDRTRVKIFNGDNKMTHIKWLDTYPDGCFFSNREMIDDPTLKPEGWFNPFTEPDKLVEELKRFPTAKSIKEHLEQFYPGIDPEPYRKRKIDENKQRDIKYCCSTWIWKFDPVKQKYIKCLKRCKHWNDCPPCKLWKIEKHKERLERLYDKRIIIAKTEDEEKAIKSSQSQNDYLRILRRDGTTASAGSLGNFQKICYLMRKEADTVASLVIAR